MVFLLVPFLRAMGRVGGMHHLQFVYQDHHSQSTSLMHLNDVNTAIDNDNILQKTSLMALDTTENLVDDSKGAN